MPGHDLIVIGASAGGVQTLCDLLQDLPRDLPAAVLIVVHTSPTSPGILPNILDRMGPMPVAHAHHEERLKPGRAYVAPPDHHLLVKAGRVALSRGPRENGFRPAVDPLFRTAARAYGPRVIGVVLSGGLDDGAEGLLYIKRAGGYAIVQDPNEAYVPSMPQAAIKSVEVDHVLTIREMPEVLSRLTRKPAPTDKGAFPMTGDNGEEIIDVAESGDDWLKTQAMPGPPSQLTCAECGGALWETTEGRMLRYRCHVGHGYTEQGLVAAEGEKLERAMWNALRVLEENAQLHRRLAERAGQSKLQAIVQLHQDRVRELDERALVIRRVLTRGGDDATVDLQQPEPVTAPAPGNNGGDNGGDNGGGNGRGRRSAKARRKGSPKVSSSPRSAADNSNGVDVSTLPLKSAEKRTAKRGRKRHEGR
jgi:two-component system chemotaxis response regulator CheB